MERIKTGFAAALGKHDPKNIAHILNSLAHKEELFIGAAIISNSYFVLEDVMCNAFSDISVLKSFQYTVHEYSVAFKLSINNHKRSRQLSRTNA